MKGELLWNLLPIKKRFCKDTDLPINLYHEPYFMERIHLFNDLFDVEKPGNF